MFQPNLGGGWKVPPCFADSQRVGLGTRTIETLPKSGMCMAVGIHPNCKCSPSVLPGRSGVKLFRGPYDKMYCCFWAFFIARCCFSLHPCAAENGTLVPRTIVLGNFVLPGPEILCSDAQSRHTKLLSNKLCIHT